MSKQALTEPSGPGHVPQLSLRKTDKALGKLAGTSTARVLSEALLRQCFVMAHVAGPLLLFIHS